MMEADIVERKGKRKDEEKMKTKQSYRNYKSLRKSYLSRCQRDPICHRENQNIHSKKRESVR
jgi:hypothetical protein